MNDVADGRCQIGLKLGEPWVIAREEEVVVSKVEAVLVDDGDGVWTVDLGVYDCPQMSGSLFLWPEAEDFETRAGLRVVDDEESLGFTVVFDT